MLNDIEGVIVELKNTNRKTKRELDVWIHYHSPQLSQFPSITGNVRANPYFYLIVKILCKLLNERFMGYEILQEAMKFRVREGVWRGFMLEVRFSDRVAQVMIETPQHEIGFLKWVEPAVTRAFDDLLDYLAEIYPELNPLSIKAKRKAQKEAFDHFYNLNYGCKNAQ